MDNKFTWIPFYMEFADKLLEYKNNRFQLILKLRNVYDKIDLDMPKLDYNNDPTDIDPFTVFGLFNRGLRKDNRLSLLGSIKDVFSIKSDLPSDFSGVPVVMPQKACYYAFSNEAPRKKDDISNIWQFYISALEYAKSQSAAKTDNFTHWFDIVIQQSCIGFAMLSMGLFWIRPYTYLNFDRTNKTLLTNTNYMSESFINTLKDKMINRSNFITYPTGENYLIVCNELRKDIESGHNDFSDFPELSYFAWQHSKEITEKSDQNYWLMAVGGNDTEWEYFYNNNVAAIGFGGSKLGDLRKYSNKEAILKRSTKLGLDHHKNNINALWDIVHSVKIGDIIIAKLGRDTIVGKGIVESDYYYDDTFSKEMPHLRKVHWLLKGNWVLKNNKFAIKTLTLYNDNHRLQEILSLFENGEYLPSIEEYTPNLSVKDWTKLIKDKEVFSDGALNLVNALYDIGGEATCTELAEQYGNNFNYYNSNGTYLAKRVHQKTNCPIYINENGEKRLWAIPFIGRKANNEQSGIWIWKLRDELYQALTELRTAGTSSAAVYSKTDFLNDVYISESDYDDLCGLILTKKNVILQGPPGVGKTFAAKRLAYSIMGEKDESRLEFVQFHQNYSYEDFVMGYRPQESGGFKLTEGVFYKFCKKAETDSREHFFIIDEINRGNLSKIFGELLMLIENDKRGDNGYSVKLTYKDESFSVPENVYIIGMMNTADRSIAMIDYALRRRFSFFDIKPAFDNENFMRSQNQQDDELFKTFVRKIKELNSAIIESLGKGYCIGHSYLCGIDDITEERLKAVARYDIIPLLEEYWFDDEDTLEKWKGEINGLFR